MDIQHDSVLDQRESVPVENIPEWISQEALQIDLTDNWLDANQDLEMPEYMLSWRGVGFFPLGSINAVTGHKKNGKTMIESLLMAAVLKDGEPIGPLCYELHETRPQPKVLFIDTEQEQSYSLMVQRRVHYIMGWDFRENNPRFRVLWLHKELTAEERYMKMCKAIWTMRPDFIILDGCRDMINDINEGESSTEFIRRTMNIATGINGVISQALHYNPGSEKMRGWLGTELGNRVAYTIEMTKEKKDTLISFTGKFVDVRGKDVDDMQFYVDDSQMKFGVPMLLDMEAMSQRMDREIAQRDMEDVRSKVIWIGAEEVSYTKLRNGIKKEFSIGSEKANRYIMDAVKLGILEQLEGNKYRINLTADATDAELDLYEQQLMQEDKPF